MAALESQGTKIGEFSETRFATRKHVHCTVGDSPLLEGENDEKKDAVGDSNNEKNAGVEGEGYAVDTERLR